MNIPGFFFDPVKKKYFKIQKNHVAPPKSPYSREAVTNQQLQAQTGQSQQLHRQRELSQRLKHDPRLRHPLTSFSSQLGNVGPGSATSTVAEYYGAALQRHIKPIVPLHCTSSQFVVGTFGGKNVLMGSFGDCESRESAMISQPLDEDCRRTSEPEYLHRTTGSIGSVIMTNGLLAWTENSGRTGNVQLHVTGLHTHVQYNFHDQQMLQLAASPSGNNWLGWTTSKLMFVGQEGHTPPCVGPGSARKDDLLTAAFKDEFTIMCGHRSGFVTFLDHRDDSATRVLRLRHDSPLNSLRAMKDGHRVLANGLSRTAIYDLRYLAAPRTSKKSEPCSSPFLGFSNRHVSDRLDLGCDYYPELNIAAMASSQGMSHHVTLYSTRTGKVISSALNKAQLGGPIPCLKFTNPRSGPPSLLMAPEGEEITLMEWRCHG